MDDEPVSPNPPPGPSPGSSPRHSVVAVGEFSGEGADSEAGGDLPLGASPRSVPLEGGAGEDDDGSSKGFRPPSVHLPSVTLAVGETSPRSKVRQEGGVAGV